MKPTPTTDTWARQEDTRGLPGYPKDSPQGSPSGAAGGKPSSPTDAEKNPASTVDTQSSEDDNLGAD